MTTLDCGHPPTKDEGPGTGYGIDSDGKKYCYACCAARDIEAMKEDGRAVLYLDAKKGIVSNWPGSLTFNTIALWTGHHNWWMVDKVTFARFIGPDGHIWSGRNMGDNDLFYCKRTKQLAD